MANKNENGDDMGGDPEKDDLPGGLLDMFGRAWMVIKTTVQKVRGTEFLLVLVAMAAVAYIAVLFFGGKWQNALLGVVIVLCLAVPATVLANLPRITASRDFGVLAKTAMWGYLVVSFVLVGLVISTSVWQEPRSIERILHIEPHVITNTIREVVAVTNYVGVVPDERTALVPARHSLFDTNLVGQIDREVGTIEVSAGKQVRFVRANTVRWMTDQSGGIDTFISKVPFVYDLRPFHEKFLSSGADFQTFKTNYLRREVFGKMLELGLASVRTSAESNLTEMVVNSYIDGELMQMLTNATFQSVVDDTRRLAKSNFLAVIDCRKEGSFISNPHLMGKRMIWKRILAMDFFNAKLLEKVPGPQFGVEAGGNPSPGASWRPFPDPNARSGVLVAGLFRVTNGAFTVVSLPTEFSNPSHVIKNQTSETLYLRLGINDDIPEDNGTGYANVTVSIEAITTK